MISLSTQMKMGERGVVDRGVEVQYECDKCDVKATCRNLLDELPMEQAIDDYRTCKVREDLKRT